MITKEISLACGEAVDHEVDGMEQDAGFLAGGLPLRNDVFGTRDGMGGIVLEGRGLTSQSNKWLSTRQVESE